MALYKRGNTYWVGFSHNGLRIQESTRTSKYQEAREYEANLKAKLWRETNLDEKPKVEWKQAALRWIQESSHKRSLKDDILHLRWLHPFLETMTLDRINRNVIETITAAKVATGVSTATVNRLLALLRSILNKAVHQWGWLDKAPKITLGKEDNRRIRWLTKKEASQLLVLLPEHLADMAAFSLATGLRQSNVKNLKWEDIDLTNKHAWVHPDQVKTNKALAVPLNQDAMQLLEKRKSIHPIYVFTYQGSPVTQVATKAWRKALKRVGIDNFRWHDLRHTWASWHIQSGTSLQELQQLGGWSCFDMVLRYAHLSSQHLKIAAESIAATVSTTVAANQIQLSEKSMCN